MGKSTILGVIGGIAVAVTMFVLLTRESEEVTNQASGVSVLAETPAPIPELVNEEVTVQPIDEARDPDSEDVKFCADWIKPGRDCLTKDELISLRGEPLFKRELGLAIESKRTGEKPVQLELVHPSDLSVPAKTVVSCDGFNEMKGQNWGPLTSAGMSDEQWFIARCGIFELVGRAGLYSSSAFETGELQAGDLEKVPVTAWPYIGEAPEKLEIDMERLPRRTWRIGYGDMETTLVDIAHADFNEDSKADIVILITSRLVGGTASFTGYALIEKTETDISLTALELY